MTHRAPFLLTTIVTLALIAFGCGSPEPLGEAAGDAPTSISDRGVQEHGKVWPRSIDSAYMGTWGDNRNSGSTLVTSFEQRRLAGQSQYLSWTEPDSVPVSVCWIRWNTRGWQVLQSIELGFIVS